MSSGRKIASNPPDGMSSQQVSQLALRCYVTAVRLGRAWNGADVMRSCECDERSMRSVVELLMELQLLRPHAATPDEYAVQSPESALQNLLMAADKSLQSTVARLQQLREAVKLVSTEFKSAHDSSFHDGFARRAVPGAAVTVGDALKAAHTEVLLACPERDLVSNIACLRQLSNREVQVRILYQSANGLGSAEAKACLLELTDFGVKVRITPALPWYLAAIDREALLLQSASGTVPSRSEHGAVSIRAPQVIDYIVALYLHWWDASPGLPAPILGAAGGGENDVPRAEQRLLLAMLSSGMTDEAIARKLGLSERTVRRRVTELTAALESNSRFQTGVNAVRAGWIR